MNPTDSIDTLHARLEELIDAKLQRRLTLLLELDALETELSQAKVILENWNKSKQPPQPEQMAAPTLTEEAPEAFDRSLIDTALRQFGPKNIPDLAFFLKINHSKLSAIVARMIDSGDLATIGSGRGRKITYKEDPDRNKLPTLAKANANGTHTCRGCGTEFEPKPGSAGVFHSYSCYQDFVRKQKSEREEKKQVKIQEEITTQKEDTVELRAHAIIPPLPKRHCSNRRCLKSFIPETGSQDRCPECRSIKGLDFDKTVIRTISPPPAGSIAIPMAHSNDKRKT